MTGTHQVFTPQPGWDDGRPRRRGLLIALAVGVLVLALVAVLVVVLLPDGRAGGQPGQSASGASAGQATPTGNRQLPAPLLAGPVAQALPDAECLQARSDPPVFACIGDAGTNTLFWTGDADRPANVSLSVSTKYGPDAWNQAIDALAPVWGADSSDTLRLLLTTTEKMEVSSSWGDFTVVPSSTVQIIRIEGRRADAPRVSMDPLPTDLTRAATAEAAQARGWTCAIMEPSTTCTMGTLTLSVRDDIGYSLVVSGVGADSPYTYDLLGELPSPAPDAAGALQRLPSDRTVTAFDGWLLSRHDGLVTLSQVGRI